MAAKSDDSKFWLWLALILAIGQCTSNARKGQQLEAELKAYQAAKEVP